MSEVYYCCCYYYYKVGGDFLEQIVNRQMYKQGMPQIKKENTKRLKKLWQKFKI